MICFDMSPTEQRATAHTTLGVTRPPGKLMMRSTIAERAAMLEGRWRRCLAISAYAMLEDAPRRESPIVAPGCRAVGR